MASHNGVQRRIITALLILIGISVFSWLFEEVTGDFRLENITYDLPVKVQEPVTSQQRQELTRILDQRYTYLGKGRQTFVFASADGQYVLKFFRFKRLKPSRIIQIGSYLPFVGSVCTKCDNKRVRRLEKLFTGYQVAYKYDQEHTGILYVHLGVTHDLNKQITVQDWLGLSHQIDLDSVAFAIQRRGRMTRDVIRDFLDRGDTVSAKKYIDKLLSMYVAEYSLGIIDQDHNIMHNTGFVGETPLRLDVGQLKRDLSVRDPVVYKKDLGKIVEERVVGWLKRYYSKISQELIREFEGEI